jgi:hypothetical protein
MIPRYVGFAVVEIRANLLEPIVEQRHVANAIDPEETPTHGAGWSSWSAQLVGPHELCAVFIDTVAVRLNDADAARSVIDREQLPRGDRVTNRALASWL